MEKRGSNALHGIMLILLVVCTWWGISYTGSTDNSLSSSLVVLMIAVLAGLYLNIILHEVGHLIGGLLSGYEFVLFFVSNLTFIKQNGKLKVKKYRTPGTGGGCMLSPLDMKDGKYPFKLYASGGFLMNFMTAAVCFVLFFYFAHTAGLWARAFLVVGLFGVFFGVSSLVPSNITLPNDGYILFNMGKEENSEMRHSYYSCLQMQKLDVEGVRPSDIPTELFDWVDEGNIKDALTVGTAGNRYKYLIDRGEIDEARALMRTLCDNPRNLPEMYRMSGNCDLLFHELIGECRQEEIDRIHTKELKRFMKMARSEMSVQRTMYAYAHLVQRDQIKAKEHLDLFNKLCISPVWSGTTICEREMMRLIDSVADGRECDVCSQ